MEEITQLKQEVEDLKRKIVAIESFVSERKLQQLAFPLDIGSQNIIGEKKLKLERIATGTITADKTLSISVDGKAYKINVL